MIAKRFGLLIPLVLVLCVGVQAETHVVTLSGFTFSPDSLLIRSGDIVRWEVASGSHTTTNGIGAADPSAGVLWDQNLAAPGASFERTFKGAGVFPYFCRPHETLGMTGKIVVASSVPALSTRVEAGLIFFILFIGGLAIWRQRDMVKDSE